MEWQAQVPIYFSTLGGEIFFLYWICFASIWGKVSELRTVEGAMFSAAIGALLCVVKGSITSLHFLSREKDIFAKGMIEKAILSSYVKRTKEPGYLTSSK